mgnify:CR=1 FL=1
MRTVQDRRGTARDGTVGPTRNRIGLASRRQSGKADLRWSAGRAAGSGEELSGATLIFFVQFFSSLASCLLVLQNHEELHGADGLEARWRF